MRGLLGTLLAFVVVAGCSGAVAPSGPTQTVSTLSPSVTRSAETTTPSPTLTVFAETGFGDPYFSDIGNIGYDVEHYLIELTVDPVANSLAGAVVITGVANANLDVFHLDLLGLEVEAVTVNDEVASFTRSSGKLAIDPFRLLPAGEGFTVAVAYHGIPEPVLSKTGMTLGWQNTDGVIFVVSEPDGARTWLPSNDHPSDKAEFTFRITVPAGMTVAANGVLDRVEEGDGAETFVWDMAEPMATYLATIVVGDLQRIERPGLDGVLIRDYVPRAMALDPLTSFIEVREMIEFYSDLFGPYPFAAYGHALVPIAYGALENQTLTLINLPTSAFEEEVTDPSLFFFPNVAAHELAHQWFGNSVTPSTWRDIWLSEGFATYAEWLWDEHLWGPTVYESQIDFAFSLLAGGPYPLAGDPGASELFSTSVYIRGALTLHALKVEVGNEAFFGILRAWADRYAHANASTEDFIALAEELSGIALEDLFDVWLYQTTIPALGEE